MRSFVQQWYSIRPAIVQQRTTHLFKVGKSTSKTHFFKVGQRRALEAVLGNRFLVDFPRVLASTMWWVDPLQKWTKNSDETHFLTVGRPTS